MSGIDQDRAGKKPFAHPRLEQEPRALDSDFQRDSCGG